MAWNLRIGVIAITAIILGCGQVTPAPPGSTPLANAVVNRRPDVVTQLLSSGASPDSADERGTAAIILAAATDQFTIVNILAQGRANIWAADEMGYTPAIYAKTSHISDDSEEGKARMQFVALLKVAGCPWPPPWPDEVLKLKEAGRWPPQPPLK